MKTQPAFLKTSIWDLFCSLNTDTQPTHAVGHSSVRLLPEPALLLLPCTPRPTPLVPEANSHLKCKQAIMRRQRTNNCPVCCQGTQHCLLSLIHPELCLQPLLHRRAPGFCLTASASGCALSSTYATASHFYQSTVKTSTGKVYLKILSQS